jgi:voltage-gated potassium channel
MIRKVRSHHKFMMSYGRALLTALKRPVLTFLTFMSGSFILLAAALFHLAEAGRNPALASFFDSLYFSVTTMTGVGFGDIVPVTGLGRFVAMGMMLGGTALFVAFTAVLATLLLEIERDQAEPK